MSLQVYFEGLRDQRAEAVKAIATATGKSAMTVGRWVKGECEPDLANKLLIAQALGMEFSEIFES